GHRQTGIVDENIDGASSGRKRCALARLFEARALIEKAREIVAIVTDARPRAAHDHLGACIRKGLGDAEPDSLRAASHEDALASKVESNQIAFLSLNLLTLDKPMVTLLASKQEDHDE